MDSKLSIKHYRENVLQTICSYVDLTYLSVAIPRLTTISHMQDRYIRVFHKHTELAKMGKMGFWIRGFTKWKHKVQE